MLQPKDTDWLNGYQRKKTKQKKPKKTTSYTCVYKRPTSDLGTHTGRKWGLKKIMIFF